MGHLAGHYTSKCANRISFSNRVVRVLLYHLLSLLELLSQVSLVLSKKSAAVASCQLQLLRAQGAGPQMHYPQATYYSKEILIHPNWCRYQQCLAKHLSQSVATSKLLIIISDILTDTLLNHYDPHLNAM